MDSTTNQVRQVLMNELGLTRASVEATMREIVVTEMEKRFRMMEQNGTLDRIMGTALENAYRDKNGYHSVSSLLSQAAHRAADKFITEHVTIGKA